MSASSAASATAAVCAAAVALSACTATAGQSVAEAGSPLSPYYTAALAYRSVDRPEDAGTTSTLSRDELIAACMADEGFEYWPDDGDVTTTGPSEDDSAGSASLDGYGIVGDYADLDPLSATAATPPSRNEAYTATMAEAEYGAYALALYGTIWDEISAAAIEGEELAWDWRRGGCEGAATHATAGDTPADTGARWTPYDEQLAAMEALPQQVDNTDEWAQVLERWSGCMADAGYTVSSWDDPARQIMREYDALIASSQPEIVSLEDTVWVEPDQNGLPDPEAFEELRARERSMATTDVDCREQVGADQAHAAIQRDLELQFLAEHRKELDAMLSWLTVHGS